MHPALFFFSPLSLGNDAHKSKRSHAVLATSAQPRERDGRRIEISKRERGRQREGLEEEEGVDEKTKNEKKRRKIGRLTTTTKG